MTNQKSSLVLQIEAWAAVSWETKCCALGRHNPRFRDFSTQASPAVSATTAAPVEYDPLKLRFISLHSN